MFGRVQFAGMKLRRGSAAVFPKIAGCIRKGAFWLSLTIGMLAKRNDETMTGCVLDRTASTIAEARKSNHTAGVSGNS